MSTVVLTFNLPEEKADALRAMCNGEAWHALDEVERIIRGNEKSGISPGRTLSEVAALVRYTLGKLEE